MPILKGWCYSGDYPEFFRDMLALTEEQLAIYAYMKDGQGFMVWQKESNEPVGFIVLYEMRIVSANVKLSILIDKKHQTQGLALEAMLEMGHYVFERLRLHKLIVEVLESNVRIQSLLTQGGFEKECVLVDEAKLDDKYLNVVRYAMYRDQYFTIKERMAI
jgi:RimJ/RimL family protein N-acetyltransferase